MLAEAVPAKKTGAEPGPAWHALTVEDSFGRLKSTPRGLTSDEAARRLEEFAAWEGNPVTRAQRLVLKLWPGGFNFISRECLFRIEWHLNRVLGR